MSLPDHDESEGVPEQPVNFRTTDWSMVLCASARQSATGEVALAKLCGMYWYPLYAFVRRRGYSVHDAQDLAQGFFAHLLQKNILNLVDQQKGKFRSFLLSSIKNFLANDWDRQHAVKRGGQCSFSSWDEEAAESLYQRGISGQLTPDQEFERSWAMVLLERVQKTLRNEYIADEKAALFHSLEASISGNAPDVSYADLGKELGMTEGAIKMAALRLRKRYRELLRAEIGNTVTTGKEIDDEIGHLVAALSS
jgi:RNA polymerase sigma factor (sigma-70 family)